MKKSNASNLCDAALEFKQVSHKDKFIHSLLLQEKLDAVRTKYLGSKLILLEKLMLDLL
jgi:hypothetical protein